MFLCFSLFTLMHNFYVCCAAIVQYHKFALFFFVRKKRKTNKRIVVGNNNDVDMQCTKAWVPHVLKRSRRRLNLITSFRVTDDVLSRRRLEVLRKSIRIYRLDILFCRKVVVTQLGTTTGRRPSHIVQPYSDWNQMPSVMLNYACAGWPVRSPP